ncbi:hypothetical protein PMIN01_10583 [Paraphaeosphaeria minitans]|uniref:Uncharacterized protein n=1 Tax=Paraphaeosphaeria minitans TaxID=565426 RepID=A0A9P6GAF3_9PLEO|nr:hypothetical protein PMIN01_10583 [Paraphaeosphaeria minitans]
MDTILTIRSACNLISGWAAYFTEVGAMIDAGLLSGTRGPEKDLHWKVPIVAAPFPRAAGVGRPDITTSYAAFQEMLKVTTRRLSSDSHGFSGNTHESYMACLWGALAGSIYI